MNPHLKRAVQLELAMEVIDRGGEVPLKTTGLSMGGTIRHGEWIVVQKTDPERIVPGDIVIYRSRDIFVAHRVIYRFREDGALTFVTKGDGHFAADEPVRADVVVARVVAVHKKGRELRVDSGLGRLVSGFMLVYSRAVCRCHRLARGRRRGAVRTTASLHRAAESSSRKLILLPTRFLAWLWKKGTR